MIYGSDLKKFVSFLGDVIERHPEKTLHGVYEYYRGLLEERVSVEKEREDKKKEWFKNLVGRCFVLNFNDSSYIVLKVDKIPVYSNWSSSTRFFVYRVVREVSRIEITKGIETVMTSWFRCPYVDDGSAVKDVREISIEEYDGLCGELDKIIDKMNSVVL